MAKILLIDGNSILCRAYFGLPDLTTSKGAHTNAVLGFLNILFKMTDEHKPDYIAVAFDVYEPTFRHKAFNDYKAQRKPADEALISQFPVIEKLLSAMNIYIAKKAGYEADDMIGTIAKMAETKGMQALVLSGDKDLLQLASDSITIMIPTTSKGKTTVKTYSDEIFREEYGLQGPRSIIDLKALMGDSSDNYKGVEGIGEKGATELLKNYGTVEGIYEHIEEIKGKTKEKLEKGKDDAFFCKWLATIKTDCDIDFSFDDALFNDPFTSEAYLIVKEYEMKSLFGRFSGVNKEEIGEPASTNNTVSDIPCPEAHKITSLSDLEVYFDKLKISENKAFSAYFCMSRNETSVVMDIPGYVFFNDSAAFVVTNGSDVTKEQVFEKINGLLKEGFLLYGAGLKEISENFGAETRDKVLDLSIGTYVLNPIRSEYNPTDIASELTGQLLPEIKEVCGKHELADLLNESDILGENEKKASDLMTKYAHALFKAGPVLLSRLKETGSEKLFFDVEMPLMFALRSMETAGIKVDREALKEYGLMLTEKIKELEKEIYDLAGLEFNINSPKQLGEVLFEKLRLPGGKKTKTGYSTAADVLEKLRNDDPIVGLILKYRTYTKLKGTYADGMGGFIRPDGRIHTVFNQTVTATGRLSSTDPNLQNIPVRQELGRQIRKMFVPGDGCVFLDADYSQIELRLLAHMSGDESLITAYNEGKDIHRITAAKVFNVPFEEVTPLMRSNAKAVNFGIIYGMSSFGLGSEINVSRKEAEEYINQYFETYPKIKRYLDDLIKSAREKGYSLTLYNRRRPIPDINDKNFMIRSGAERIAMNSPIQGTAADIMKIALVNTDRRLRQEKLKSRILLQVHDELLLEVPLSEKETVSKILEEEMTGAAALKVKLEVSVGCGDNWDDAH